MDVKSPIVEKHNMKPILKWHYFKIINYFNNLFFPNLNSGDYIGQKLREKYFDPKGKGTSTMLDDLVKTRESKTALQHSPKTTEEAGDFF